MPLFPEAPLSDMRKRPFSCIGTRLWYILLGELYLSLSWVKGEGISLGFTALVVADFRRWWSVKPSSECSPKMFPLSCGQHDITGQSIWQNTECCCLPTKVILIYLLAVSCFQTARLTGADVSARRSLHHAVVGLKLL